MFSWLIGGLDDLALPPLRGEPDGHEHEAKRYKRGSQCRLTVKGHYGGHDEHGDGGKR